MAHQLSIPQRITIARQLDEGKSYAEIARQIGVHRSTVKREVDRNSYEGEYCPQRAHSLALYRKTENGKDCTPPLRTKTYRLNDSRRYKRMLPNYRTFRRRLSLYYRERFAEVFRIRRKRKRFYFYNDRFIFRPVSYKLWKQEYDRDRVRIDYRPLTFLQKLWRKYRYNFNQDCEVSCPTDEKAEQNPLFRIVKRKLRKPAGIESANKLTRTRPVSSYTPKENKTHSTSTTFTVKAKQTVPP